MSREFIQPGYANEAWQKPSGQMKVFFSRRPVKNNKKSEDLGRDVFDEKIFIHKITSDAQHNLPIRPIRPSDKIEFPVEWARFEQTGESKIVGFPIDHWPVLSDTQKMEFKAINVQTVEQLADLSDIALQTFMGGQAIRQKARLFLDPAKAESEKVAKLEAEMAEMRKLLEAATAPKAKA